MIEDNEENWRLMAFRECALLYVRLLSAQRLGQHSYAMSPPLEEMRAIVRLFQLPSWIIPSFESIPDAATKFVDYVMHRRISEGNGFADSPKPKWLPDEFAHK